MPLFRTRLINSEFDITNEEGVVHDTVEEASRTAIVTAIDVARGLFASGERCPHIQIYILDGEETVARHMVRVEVTDVPF
jgi:hypothetical protein